MYPPWCSSGHRRLRNPLGTAQPIDVTILPNPDPNVNPYYSSYDYMGGGPVYKVPDGMPGSANLLMVYHAEIPTVTTQSFYSVLALAKSTDGGPHSFVNVAKHAAQDLAGKIVQAPSLDYSGRGLHCRTTRLGCREL